MVGWAVANGYLQRNRAVNAAWFGADPDPWRSYRALIEAHGVEAEVVVDLGAGTVDAGEEWFRSERAGERCSPRVVSVDRSWQALARNSGKHRVVADAGRLPLRADSVDLVLSRYAVEHVREPESMMQEVARVLKPGKALIFVTPHRWCYVSLVSWLTPVWFHRLVYKLLGQSDDKLPCCTTYYRMNTPGRIRARAQAMGLEVTELIVTVGPPEYTKIFPPAVHRLFVWFHWLLERSPRLRNCLGVNLFGVLRKQPFLASSPRHSSGQRVVWHAAK